MKRKAFTCGACFKGFDVAEQAEAHWLAEHEPQTCPVCGLLLDDGYCHECERDIAKTDAVLTPPSEPTEK